MTVKEYQKFIENRRAKAREKYRLKKGKVNERRRELYKQNKPIVQMDLVRFAANYPEYAKQIKLTSNAKLRLLAREFSSFVKTYLGCSKCGFAAHSAALQFHHTNPTNKDDGITKMVNKGRSIKALKAEMKKCVVLCANCHAIHHAFESQKLKPGSSVSSS